MGELVVFLHNFTSWYYGLFWFRGKGERRGLVCQQWLLVEECLLFSAGKECRKFKFMCMRFLTSKIPLFKNIAKIWFSAAQGVSQCKFPEWQMSAPWNSQDETADFCAFPCESKQQVVSVLAAHLREANSSCSVPVILLPLLLSKWETNWWGEGLSYSSSRNSLIKVTTK